MGTAPILKTLVEPHYEEVTVDLDKISLPATMVEAMIETVREHTVEETKFNHNGFGHESTNNKSIEWYTPPWLFEALGLEFDLDPCHPPVKLDWIPVKQTYSLPQDGLELPWNGTVWLNPPYGKNTGRWLKRLAKHRDGLTIVFSRTDTKWYHEHVATADAILFLKKRVQFCDASGKPAAGSPGCGSLLAAWGEKSVEALKRLKHLGLLALKVETVVEPSPEAQLFNYLADTQSVLPTGEFVEPQRHYKETIVDTSFEAVNAFLVHQAGTGFTYYIRDPKELEQLFGFDKQAIEDLLENGSVTTTAPNTPDTYTLTKIKCDLSGPIFPAKKPG